VNIPRGLGHSDNDYKQQPKVPGDLFRDQRTKEDYIIQFIGSAVVAGGAYIYATHLFTNAVREFHYAETQHLLLLRDNSLGDISLLTPQQVRSQYFKNIQDAFKGNQEAEAAMLSQENQLLRDLLMIGAESEEAGVFDQRIVEIAKSMVFYGKGIPDLESIKKALMAHKTSVTPEDYIDDLAKRVFNEATTQENLRVGANRATNLTASESGFIGNYFKKSVSGSSDNTRMVSAARKLKAAPSPELSDTEKKVLAVLIGDNAQYKGQFRDSGFGPHFKKSQSDRLQVVLNEIFHTGDKLHASQGMGVIRDFNKGLNNVVLQAISDSGHPYVEMARTAVNAEQQARRSFFRGYRNHYSFQYNKNTMMGNVPNTGILRNVLTDRSFDEIGKIKDFGGGVSKFVSMDAPTVIDDFLGGSKVKLGKATGIIGRDKALTKAVLSELNLVDKINTTGNKQLFLKPSTVSKIQEQKKAGKAIDIKALLKEDAYIRKNIGTEIIENAELSHVTKRGGVTVRGNKISVGYIWGNMEGNLTDKTTSLRKKLEIMGDLPEKARGTTRLYVAETDVTKDSFGRSINQTFMSSDLNKLLVHMEQTNPVAPEILTEDYTKTRRSTLRYIDVDNSQYKQLPKGIISAQGNTELTALVEGSIPIINPRSPYVEGLNLRTRKGLIAAAKQAGTITEIPIHSDSRIINEFKDQEFEEFLNDTMNNRKIAFARLADGKTKLIGTQMDTPIETQIARAKKFYKSSRAAILDIETDNIEGSDVKILTELTMYNRKYSGVDKIVHTQKQQAKTLIELAEKLKGIDVIGTQTRSDFDELEKMAEHLSGAGLGDDVSAQLRKAGTVFRHTVKHKLFDLEIIPQVAGMADLGSTSQSFLTASFLKRNQEHTSHQDVIDAFDLTEHFKDPFLENADSIKLVNDAPIVYDTGSMHNLRGRIMQPVGIKTSELDGGTTSIIYREFTTTLRGGSHKIRPTGTFFEETANSVAILGANFNKRTVVDHSILREQIKEIHLLFICRSSYTTKSL